jgi:hypothetical protein
LGYFTQLDPEFGGVSKLVALIWIGTLVAAFLLLRATPPLNPIRAAFRRRAALVAAGFGGVGLVQILLRWVEWMIGAPLDDTIPVLDWRLWSYLIMLGAIGYLIYAYFYLWPRHTQEVAANRQMRVVKPAQQRKLQQAPAPTERAAPAEPRPVATTTRREARRDRKRRTR